MSHAPALVQAAHEDPSLYAWSFIPQTMEEAERYIGTALKWQEEGTAVPFATVRLTDGKVIGSTRFFEITRWAWPSGHERFGRVEPDVCEIGSTWLAGSAVRTRANTEAKLLMLTQAFEVWDIFRVCFHTDARNSRSRAALERIGARFEGILRSHRLASDITPRDSARFAIVKEDWPLAKQHIQTMLESYPTSNQSALG